MEVGGKIKPGEHLTGSKMAWRRWEKWLITLIDGACLKCALRPFTSPAKYFSRSLKAIAIGYRPRRCKLNNTLKPKASPYNDEKTCSSDKPQADSGR